MSASGVARWEDRGKCLDGVSSDWVAESGALDSFTPLQLDAFHAVWTLDPPSCKQISTPSPVRPRQCDPLNRSEALIRFHVGTWVIRPCTVNNQTTNRVGQVCGVGWYVWRPGGVDGEKHAA